MSAPKRKTTKVISERNSIPELLGKKILIIDDAKVVVLRVEYDLRKCGFRKIKSLTDSREAISVLREFQPDILLLDIEMPHIDGLEILKQMGASDEFSKIIVLMLSASNEKRDRSLELGALSFIPKPWSIEKLMSTISSTCRLANRFGTR